MKLLLNFLLGVYFTQNVIGESTTTITISEIVISNTPFLKFTIATPSNTPFKALSMNISSDIVIDTSHTAFSFFNQGKIGVSNSNKLFADNGGSMLSWVMTMNINNGFFIGLAGNEEQSSPANLYIPMSSNPTCLDHIELIIGQQSSTNDETVSMPTPNLVHPYSSCVSYPTINPACPPNFYGFDFTGDGIGAAGDCYRLMNDLQSYSQECVDSLKQWFETDIITHDVCIRKFAAVQNMQLEL